MCHGKKLGAFLMAVAIACLYVSSVAAATTRKRTPFTAFTQTPLAGGDTSPSMPQHTTPNKPVAEALMKPDVTAKGFSAQNAYYFARMSKIVYSPGNEVKGLIVGNATCEGLGFDRFHWFEADRELASASLFDDIQDTEAFVAANDDIIVVVFRGTKEFADWAANLKASKRDCPSGWGGPESGKVHEGFDDGVDTVWTTGGMHKTIKKLYDEEGKNRKLYLAGHSLGGALATITAARLAFADDMNVAAIYTVGSPMVFDEKVAKYFDSKVNHGALMKDKYFRCRNNNDAVTRLSPIGGYKHVGTEVYFDRFGTIAQCSFADQLLGRLTSYLRGDFIEDINDHALSEYVRLLKQIVINSKVSVLDKAASVVMDAIMSATRKVAPDVADNIGQSLKTRLEHIEKVKGVVKEAADEERCTGDIVGSLSE